MTKHQAQEVAAKLQKAGRTNFYIFRTRNGWALAQGHATQCKKGSDMMYHAYRY